MWTFDPLKTAILPDAWAAALRAIRQIAPSAIIAGGALRDLGLGGAVKDLDVFVPAEETEGGYYDRKPAGWTYRGGFSVGGGSYAGSMRDEVVAVDTWEVPGLGLPLQIIHCNFPGGRDFAGQALGCLDFDLCRVGHNGVSPLFDMALVTADPNTMTLVHCPNATQAKRSLKRAERFCDRYPGLMIDVSKAKPFMEPVQFLELGI